MSVRYQSEGPVAVVTIDRPEVANAVDAPTALELAELAVYGLPLDLLEHTLRDIEAVDAEALRRFADRPQGGTVHRRLSNADPAQLAADGALLP